MSLLLTAVSVLGIAALAWAARKLLASPVCPICAGVAGTWLWMLAARELGFAVDAPALALLLGATVAGAAYQLEKRLPAERSALAWKTLFVTSGLGTAYGLAVPNWVVAGAGLAVLFVLTKAFLAAPPRASPRSEAAIAELEKQMKRCC
jgi:hypothetical protein